MKHARNVIGLLCLVAALPMAGCLAVAVGAAAGVGTYAYVTGKLETTQDVSLDAGWEATKKGIADLQFAVGEEKKDALYGELHAKTADGRNVTVTLKSVSEKSTEFSVRVGAFGDEALSRTIMDKIKAHF